jgi:hypothetical protein
MSIRMNTRVNTRPVDLFADYLDDINVVVDRVGRDVYEDYKPVILARLTEIPGPSSQPVKWTSDKQRKAYFASNGFGGGIPTVRTGTIAQAWDVEYIVDPGAFRVLIINRNPKSKFLYGGASLRSNPRFQQQQHKNTGWVTVAPVIAYFVESMATDFRARLKQEIGDFVSTVGTSSRAFTGG